MVNKNTEKVEHANRFRDQPTSKDAANRGMQVYARQIKYGRRANKTE